MADSPKISNTQHLINFIIGVGSLALLVIGSLCLTGNDELCGPVGHTGGIIMVSFGAVFMGLNILICCCAVLCISIGTLCCGYEG